MWGVPSPFEDTDSDGNVNGRDQNSNNDNYNDNLQVWVVFRTNAVSGAYSGSSDVWVAVVAPSVNPYFPEQFDFSSSVALYRWQETLASPPGAAQVLNPYGPLDNIRTVAELKTPEGYPVLLAGPTSGVYDIYIEVSASRYEHFIDSTSAPSDWSSSNRTVQSFLANRQESYDGRVAVDMDPDFDDITTPAENACGMNPNSNDTDGDGMRAAERTQRAGGSPAWPETLLGL